MKAKGIKSVLRKKFTDFAESISDPELRKLVLRDGMITGGSIASMLLGEKPNDYDIYFKTLATVAGVAEYYVREFGKRESSESNGLLRPTGALPTEISVVRDECDSLPEGIRVKIKIRSAGVASENSAQTNYQYFEQFDDGELSGDYVAAITATVADKEEKDKQKYRPVFLSQNAITLSDGIQLVIRFYGTPEQIHENYDFVHCTCCWDALTGDLILPPAALESLLAKDLRYIASRYPVCSIIRTRKFIKRGWTITAGQYLKIVWAISKLDLSDIEVLEDQLTGVDTAYFLEIIKLLGNRMEETGTKEIDESYLMQLIDEIF